jgi:type IV pilus assembly protein PilM
MALRHLVGLDIGSKAVKAIQLTEDRQEYRITDFAAAEVSPDRSIVDVLADLFRRRRFKTRRVATSVSGRNVFVRHVSMPTMTDPELANAAKYELGKYIPVEADEVLHDAQKLEEAAAPVEGQEPEMRVLLVAAKRTFIDEHVALVEQAGLVPHLVDVDSFALGNAYEMSGRVNDQAVSSGKLVALVDIGASKTNINIVDGQKSFFTREFYKGGNDVTEALARKLSIDAAQAESLKREGPPAQGPGKPDAAGSVFEQLETEGQGIPETKGQTKIVILEKGDTKRFYAGGGDEVQDTIASVLDEICHDVLLSLDYFENQYDRRVEELFVTGGGAHTRGLQEALERTAQKPVSLWNPFSNFPAQLPDEAVKELADYAGQASIALGLASRIVP